MKPRIRFRTPTVILAGLLILLDRSLLALMPFAAALCHEAGHLIVMRLFHVPIREIEITLFGAEIRTQPHTLSTLAAVAVYSAGAGANLLCAILVSLMPDAGQATQFFAASSFALAILNLLPIGSLDGGCILTALLHRLAPAGGRTIFAAIQAVALFFLWLAAVSLLLICGGNLSLYLFCVYMFWELYLRGRTDTAPEYFSYRTRV
ncbi:MAG: hypothetical protein E7632_00055 [Ruminococcaceae bacterium]|nr:hypothetical protein [Oscillospiraceae bacterium]